MATDKHNYQSLMSPLETITTAKPNEHHPSNRSSNRPVVENSFAKSDDYLAHVARATNDAVRDWDVVDGSLFWPQGLESLFGYNDAPLGQSDLSFWQQRVHPADRTRLCADIEETLASSHETWSGEYRFRKHDGEYLNILERAFITRNPSGQAQRWLGSLMDISARQKLQDQLCRSQKMEAFGQLAAGVAHDFNNFLTTILGYSDLVLSEPGMGRVVQSHIQEIRGAAGRASALAGHLLAFSRKQTLAPHVIEANDFVHNLERTLLRLLGDNITIVPELHRAKGGLHIRVDPGQFTQILLNLAVNARDAMRSGGQLTLQTSTSVIREEDDATGEIDGLASGDYVVISIIDNGIGMDEQVRRHLFEPFFTTKKGMSSGLGLATCYGIVRQSGGSIRIASETGKGTRVDIYLPKVAAPPPPSYRKPSNRRLPTGTESILVLEDDISVRHMSVRILQNLGYKVSEAATGDDAQRHFQEGASAVDLVLTDIVMPQMSGRFFADWLRTVSPETKVVFVSGYLEDSLHPGDRLENGMFFLPKPFDPEQLATTIRQVLDS
jgi:two-component system, cell cycle sensor histidine kinase and response regulator CckA